MMVDREFWLGSFVGFIFQGISIALKPYIPDLRMLNHILHAAGTVNSKDIASAAQGPELQCILKVKEDLR